MRPCKLFLACGPFPPHLELRVREDCRHRALYEVEPGEPVYTDFQRCGLMEGLEELFPQEAGVETALWEGRAENGYYGTLVGGAVRVYAFAAPALPEHAQALGALTAACDAVGARLTLFLY